MEQDAEGDEMRVTLNINWRMVGGVALVAAIAIIGIGLVAVGGYAVVQIVQGRQARLATPTTTTTLSRTDYITASATLMQRYGELIGANQDGLQNLPNRSDQAQNVADGVRRIAA